MEESILEGVSVGQWGEWSNHVLIELKEHSADLRAIRKENADAFRDFQREVEQVQVNFRKELGDIIKDNTAALADVREELQQVRLDNSTKDAIAFRDLQKELELIRIDIQGLKLKTGWRASLRSSLGGFIPAAALVIIWLIKTYGG